MPSIAVVGSVNLDIVAKVARLPRPGETVTSPATMLPSRSPAAGSGQVHASASVTTNATTVPAIGRNARRAGARTRP